MTPQKSPPDVGALTSQMRRGGAMLWLGTAMTGGAALQLLWLGARRVFGVVFALIVLFEQWGWRPLSAALRAIGHLAPVAAAERFIGNLPPYAALVTFAVPTALLVPLKLLALYLIANGHAFSAGALFIGAKIVGTALVARLYQLTEQQLMQIAWVRRVRDVLMPRLHALHEAIRSSWAWRYGRVLKQKVKRVLLPITAQIKARILALLAMRRGPV